MNESSNGDPLSLLLAPAMLAEELRVEMPEAEELLGRAVGLLRFPVSYVLGSDGLSPALSMITNQAVNDFVDLSYELLALRGRPALRAARSIFELLVSALDVVTDDDAAQRYERHRHIAPQVRAEASLGLERLPRRVAVKKKRAMSRAAVASKVNADAAIAEYGASYRARWASRNLYERSVSHGLGPDYAFYRLASMFLHGTAGGTDGTITYALGPNPVHRTGPNLQACCPAWLNGIRAFRGIVDVLRTNVDGLDETELCASIDDLLDAWPRYYEAVQSIDSRLWPAEAPQADIAIVAVSRRGKLRWLLLDTATNDLLEAQAPSIDALSSEQRRNLDAIVAKVSGDPDRYDDWVTIAMHGVRVNPKPDAKRLPATSFLVPKSDPRSRREPKAITDIDDIE